MPICGGDRPLLPLPTRGGRNDGNDGDLNLSLSSSPPSPPSFLPRVKCDGITAGNFRFEHIFASSPVSPRHLNRANDGLS